MYNDRRNALKKRKIKREQRIIRLQRKAMFLNYTMKTRDVLNEYKRKAQAVAILSERERKSAVFKISEIYCCCVFYDFYFIKTDIIVYRQTSSKTHVFIEM